MKIAMIGQKGYPALSGGIEKHVQELSENLANKDHEVIVFSRGWYCGDLEKETKVKRVFVPTIRTKHLDAIIHTFASIVAATWMKVDIYHIHGVGPALLAWLPKLLRPSAKVVVTFHCIDRKQKKWGLFARLMLWLGEIFACRFPDKTIVVSQTLADYVRLKYKTEPNYIPNGVNIPSENKEKKLLKQFNLEPNKYFAMVSRLVEHKGQKTLIRGWQLARETRPDLFKEHKLVIVGGSSFTDSYEKELKALADNDKSIILSGEQLGKNLHALFANAQAVVHPSVAEGLPIAVLEAMSHGKCVLASDIPEHLEVVNQHGLSFRKGDAKHLAENLIMMAEAPELTNHVGQTAAQFVRDNYCWKEITTQIEVLYNRLNINQKENLLITWLTKRKPLL